MNSILVSVLIATYNRSESLRETLDSLRKQKLTSLNAKNVEIIVVNNNSTDATEKVVTEAAVGSAFEIRHISEPRQGVSIARNRGIRESRGEYLFFTDDDVIADAGWIEAYYEAFKQGADCAGGKIVPIWEKSPEPWITDSEFKNAFSGIFALIDHGNKSFVLKTLALDFFYGANMAFKKSCFEELGGLREDLGMIGKRRRYGEDTELVKRFFEAGKVMIYKPEAVIHHKVPSSRMTMKYVRKWRFDKALDAVPEKAGIWLWKECFLNGIAAMGSYLKGKKNEGIKLELQFWTQLGQIKGGFQ